MRIWTIRIPVTRTLGVTGPETPGLTLLATINLSRAVSDYRDASRSRMPPVRGSQRGECDAGDTVRSGVSPFLVVATAYGRRGDTVPTRRHGTVSAQNRHLAKGVIRLI